MPFFPVSLSMKKRTKVEVWITKKFFLPFWICVKKEKRILFPCQTRPDSKMGPKTREKKRYFRETKVPSSSSTPDVVGHSSYWRLSPKWNLFQKLTWKQVPIERQPFNTVHLIEMTLLRTILVLDRDFNIKAGTKFGQGGHTSPLLSIWESDPCLFFNRRI